MKPSKDISRLIEIMAALRDPDTGCPWDQKQTFATIAPYTIEEAYEVADAIARGDLPHLKDELGDLLLQVVYHARMAEEKGAFAFGDVVEAVTTKMIRRHPHVFGTEAERAAGVAPGFWERPRRRRSRTRHGARRSRRRARRPPRPDARHQVAEQSRQGRIRLAVAGARVRQAQRGDRRAGGGDRRDDRTSPDRAAIEEEFGDLLFVVANVARHLKLDPEAALRAANDKFTRRFRYIEEQLAQRGLFARHSQTSPRWTPCGTRRRPTATN